MVFTIHRYIFRDLVKTFVLATALLSVVLGLGVMLRPLRQIGVDPARVPELVLCTLPITLTMVLPIAALLSATLNYGRLAAENEINACRSSGISLQTLIYPALAMGLLVAMLTLLLVFHVIPSYTERFESVIREDAEATIYRHIAKKGSLGKFIPGLMVHADRVEPQNHRLLGVAAVKHSRDGIERTFSARQVDIDVQSRAGGNVVRLKFKDVTVVMDDGSFLDEPRHVFYARLPRLLRDSIKFKKPADLRRIRNDMTRFAPVRRLLERFQDQLMVERYYRWCDSQLAAGTPLVIEVPREGRFEVYAARCFLRDDKSDDIRDQSKAILTVRNALPIMVWLFAPDDPPGATPQRYYRAAAGALEVDAQADEPLVTLQLDDVKAGRSDDVERMQAVVWRDRHGSSVPQRLVEGSRGLTLEQALAQPIPLAQPSAKLTALQRLLVRKCRRLAVEIAMAWQSRLAFGVSCVALVLLGTALGIIFRSGHLLTAFGVSFVPAGLCLITIFTGKHIAEQSTAAATLAGTLFLWSGIAAVALANTVIYRVLLRR